MQIDESAVILEFIDFYKTGSEGKMDLKYLVSDRKPQLHKN